MPPATPASKVSLRELADLAIGTPEVGAVNFTALHTLIVAMLKNLHLQDTQVDFQSLSPEQSRSFEGARTSQSTPQMGVSKEKRKSSVARVPARTLESQVKDLGGQVQDLGQQVKTLDSQMQGILDHIQYFTALVSGVDLDTQDWLGNQEMGKDLAQEMASPATEMTGPTADMATPTLEKTKLEKTTPMPRMATPELGVATAMPEASVPVSGMATLVPEKVRRGLMKMWKDKPKAMELLQTITQDVKTLQEVREKAQELTPIKLLQRIKEVEQRVRSREEVLEPLSRKLTLIPPGEEVTMVTWEELEQAIVDGWKASQGVNKSNGGPGCGSGLPLFLFGQPRFPSLRTSQYFYLRLLLSFLLFNQGSESTTALLKRRSLKQVSLSPNDMAPGRSSTKSSSVDEAPDSAGGFGPGQTLPGTSRSGQPSKGVPGRERGRVTSAAGFPGKEQHPSAHDEASLAKTQHPSESQLRMEPREQFGFAHPRREEQDAHPGPAPEDLASARGGRHHVYPDPTGAVHVSTGQVYAWPDQHRLQPLAPDQPELLPPSTHPHDVFPFSTSQLGMMPPGMGGQESVGPSTGQHDGVPLRVPGTEQQGSALPSVEQPGAVPPGTYQQGVRLAGTDQRGMEQAGMDESGMGPLGIDQHGFAIFGTDQQGPVPPLTDQHVLGSPGLMQAVTDQQGFIQLSMETPEFIQLGIQQPGLVQPGAYPPSWVQPGAYPGLVQPGAVQPGLVQPSAVQPGAGQPGAGQPGAGQPGAGQPGFVQPGAGQPGAGQPGSVQPGAGQPVAGQPGAGQPGFVQPGAGQPGLVQPGAGQPGAGRPGFVQPGAGRPGFVQPGAGQPGVGQPGSVQPGAGQPGSVQPGVGQPGAGQPGSIQPGAGQPGSVQPGAGQPGAGQPGSVQPGAGQPGAGQPGFVQPGAGQPGASQPGSVQPGAGQPGFVQPGAGQPGAGQPGSVQPGAGQPGSVQPGAGQPGAGQPGSVQPGAGQPGAGQPVFVQPGAGQPGFVQPGAGQPVASQPGLVQLGASQPGFVQPGAGQPGWPGAGWPGAGQPGFVQPGAGQPGLVQPGAGQPGFVQPGAGRPGAGQPGAGQTGFVQPGVGQPGLVQPGADQLDLVQPGMDQHGLVQSGVYAPGLVQPGAYPRGAVQPGLYPHGFMQPGVDQRGLRQRGTDYQGLVPPGTEFHGFPFHVDSPTFVSPHPYQHGVVPPGRDQHTQVSPLLAKKGSMSPGTDRRGPTPVSTGMESAHPGQQHLVPPGPYQRDHTPSIPDSRGFMYAGPRGPGYPDVDKYVQIGLDANQPETHIQTPPRQDTTALRSTDSLRHLYQVSSERSNVLGERHDSLDRVAPSFPVAVETFRMMGELIALYMELKENMKELDEKKAGQSDLEKIQYLLSLMVQKTIPPEVQDQVKTLKALTKEVRQEKAKMDKIQKILEGEVHPEMGTEGKGSQLGLQLGILRVTMADIEKELAELRDSQERGKTSMEHSVSEASLYLQDQLDKLRMIIESMLASSSTLLTMSIAPHKTPITLTPGGIDPEATCPACSLDLSHQVSTLVRRYEQLQNMVNSLAASRPSKKAKLQSQDEELLGHVQRAILQVQGDCEKLNITTSNLIADHQQKQKDINALYQGLEKLEREKANREHLEMEIDVKADKSALAGKVSRVQFDATTEQLNHMMQELVAKMSGQEQDWQKMLDRLLVEMDSKLDRLELDPVKQLLEDRWKPLRQQLRERPPFYQADEAACMRRQLLAHFHCLSCDRPLETPVTGQPIPVTPMGPSLPGNRSTRPYTIFELDQVRQQSRSLKLGSTAFPRADLAPLERSVGRLHSMHSKMLMDIEKVQIHYGGSVKASSQMIRELLQAQCLSSPCYKRVPDTAEYTYSPVPRPCGGSHTLTYPYRRTRLQHLPQGLHPEEIQLALKHEVDILGLDGHIYKGRMDTRLPGIPGKDSSSITRHKAKLSRPHVQRQPSLGDNGQLPSRPQSAEVPAGNTSAPSRQRTDRPVSSQGRLSQPLSPREGPEMRLEVPPAEGQEAPPRGRGPPLLTEQSSE
ncbi:glutamine-rich protein 2 [Sturnira hondurensis]|uniref:glutamine-rich protein 2 n=1 Tax=Sturnira hondurensis TaxID=192404 RepID=UPI00187AF557|nr:glutamine-rich protein 2 [Sturnira hondurensis]